MVFPGDLRANEQPPLGSVHVLFLREHNRVARAMKALNPGWNDERIFQESRRVVNGEYQHIIYNEFLPIMIGKQFLDNFGLSPLTRGFSDAYRYAIRLALTLYGRILFNDIKFYSKGLILIPELQTNFLVQHSGLVIH